MDAVQLLQWHYLIFLLPFGLSGLFLLLSSVRLGGHRLGGAHHGHAVAHHLGAGHGHDLAPRELPVAHPPAPAHGLAHPQHHLSLGHGQPARSTIAQGVAGADIAAVSPGNLREMSPELRSPWPIRLLGADRAPLTIVVEAGALTWGVSGFWANRLLVHGVDPSLFQVLPSIAVAAVCGVLGARATSAVVARIIPEDASADIPREALFGLTGEVAFRTTQTTGRIVIYDDYGTLHDEMCRTAKGMEPIEKGRAARVVDIEPNGHLIVEEA